jgi:glycosyltransferase involved in cell wall biosynthesis
VRIALFSGNYNYLREGANQALNTLVRYAEERAGCEVRVYSPVTATPAFEPAGTLVPVPSVALPVRGEFRLALGLPRAIRADVARFAPDVVHVSTPDILNTRAQTFAKRLGVPVVASLHTRFEAYLDYYGLGWLRPAAEAHLRRFYRRSDHVLVPTPGLAAEMRATRVDDNVSVWSRGVDRERFSPDRRDMEWRRAQGFADDETVVLFFGRPVLEKGVATFVSVMRAVQQEPKARVLVAGAGPAESALAALPGSVLAGHLDGADLARAVASADLMLSPSTTETFGNVVLEAMASGLPVVHADTPSATALLRDGETGLICPPRDEAAYAEAVLRLVRSVQLRHKLGSAAREASAAFSWDAASASVVEVYRALKERRP